ncbi:hypothetical protein [Streptomyces sp. NPDC048142]|uniref:hypothetical protein n=1 Tax=Streptomyces sp. NPDC048142 TaxID=3365501 RepID=UPI003715D89F
MNKAPEFDCATCADRGGWDVYHKSTDGLMGWIRCTECPTTPAAWKIPEPFYRSEWKRGPAELAAQPPF